jgi:hypothetical protein
MRASGANRFAADFETRLTAGAAACPISALP